MSDQPPAPPQPRQPEVLMVLPGLDIWEHPLDTAGPPWCRTVYPAIQCACGRYRLVWRDHHEGA